MMSFTVRLAGIRQRRVLAPGSGGHACQSFACSQVITLGEMDWIIIGWQHLKEMQGEFFGGRFNLSKILTCLCSAHSRDALDDTYEVIKSEGVGPHGGIMHSYSGSLEMAQRFINLV